MPSTPAATSAPSSGGGGSTMSMLQMEEAHVKAFPAKTQGTGGIPTHGRLINGVKVFELTSAPVRWEVSPGQFVDAFAYNGQIPGPELRVKQGDRIRIVFHNALGEASSVHFHGLTVPNAMDGVPFLTQPPVQPGGTFVYTFKVVDNPGTYMYHSHENAVVQVPKGLLGSFVIEPPKRSWDQETTLVLGDGDLGFTINAKGFPATSPIVAKRGSRVLIRFMNAGQLLHPMHLHGFHFTVIARDGRPVGSPYDLDTLVVAPGERYDVVFTANQLGAWAFHCHILSHAEGAEGMFGMVTAVVVA
jgi:FtsP/CotA-like multicopper oxidase with cupredoxin domain